MHDDEDEISHLIVEWREKDEQYWANIILAIDNYLYSNHDRLNLLKKISKM